jgi:hypothetical protein
MVRSARSSVTSTSDQGAAPFRGTPRFRPSVPATRRRAARGAFRAGHRVHRLVCHALRDPLQIPGALGRLARAGGAPSPRRARAPCVAAAPGVLAIEDEAVGERAEREHAGQRRDSAGDDAFGRARLAAAHEVGHVESALLWLVRALPVSGCARTSARRSARLWRGLVDQDAVPEVAVVLGGELLCGDRR